ncbi:unnamed protein product [Closterium sp. NIES-53]
MAPVGPALAPRGPERPHPERAARPEEPEPSRAALPELSRATLPEPSRAACTGPSRPTCLRGAPTAFPPTTAITLTAPMASPPVLAFDAEGRPVKFETWLDDLHLFLQLTAKEDISLYDHALGHATAPAATADSTACSQWQTRDAHARFAIRNSLPIDEREHFGQHKTAQALYTAVVARYSSPASAALGRLSLPYLHVHREDVEPEVHPIRSSQSTPFLVQQLRTTLAALGFAPSTADPSLFLRTDTSLPPFYILVYVDDLVFATANTAGLAYVKARRTITLTQSHMVQQVLQRFGFTYSSPQATPLPTRHSLSALPSDESVESSGPYPELVGCLMYQMTCTRPDLAYPLSILARYVAPGRHRPEHMTAAKRVLRYLCSTSGMGLVLGGQSLVVLTGHADASWADDQTTQRSSQGYTFSLGSGYVSWRATRSSSVLGSICEAEIYAGAMAAQELRWLTYLLTDLGEPPHSPPVLYVDNKAMLALCREQRLEHRTKHIALRYFLAREL